MKERRRKKIKLVLQRCDRTHIWRKKDDKKGRGEKQMRKEIPRWNGQHQNKQLRLKSFL